MKKSLQINLMLLLIAVVTSRMASFAIQADEGGIPRHDDEPKVTICHRTASHTNPYTTNDVDQSSVDGTGGQGDHFLNHTGPVWFAGIEVEWGDIIPPVEGAHDGLNWDADGQAIWNNDCNLPTDEDNDEPGDDDPSDDPEPTDEPEEESRRSKLTIDPSCEDRFHATMYLTENGQPVEGVEVSFTYNSTRTARTNQDGMARVGYDKAEDRKVTASAPGFDSQEVFANMPDDCEEEKSNDDSNSSDDSGEVLGTSTETSSKSSGQVLGVSTLADTGVAQEAISMGFFSAAGIINMIAFGKTVYAKKIK